MDRVVRQRHEPIAAGGRLRSFGGKITDNTLAARRVYEQEKGRPARLLFVLSVKDGRIMKANLRLSRRHVTHGASVFLLCLILAAPTPSSTHREWFRGLDLEPALSEAHLVMVGRVAHVDETKIVMGGKGERSLLQFKFEPVLVLKGVFSRDSLSLTSDDLGVQRFADTSPIESGQFRLLMLGRSMQGYAIN
ncbi:MAG TPA: hypothetical protein VF905_01235, partial [Nitrospirota bacterium]